jgi:AcrR family transcriptional regulator
MKVSQEKKKEIRRDLIKAAVEVISEKGFRSATMREISIRAGYSAATIYNYFPSKEKVLFGYFQEKQLELLELLEDIPDFNAFTLKEKLQVQLESLLDLYLPDREFAREAYQLIFDSPLRTFSEFRPVKKIFTDTVAEYFNAAVEENEIPEMAFSGFIVNLYWDYAGLMIFYWLRDDSTGFTNTSVLIDMSLDIIVAVLQSDILNRTADMLAFLFKSHLYSNVDVIHSLFSSVREVHDKMMSSGDKAPTAGREE